MGFGVGPEVEGFAADGVEPAEIIEPHHVVGVGMGVDDGVDHVDMVGDALKAKFRRGIDENALAGIGEDDGWAGALVARIGAGARLTVAANHGNPGAGAGAEKEQFEGIHLHLGL